MKKKINYDKAEATSLNEAKTCHAELVSASKKQTLKQVQGDMSKNAAFTLAETLITLLIIGVIAAITIPSFLSNINEETLGKQRTAAAKKLSEGFAQMRTGGVLANKYENTSAFVSEMRKYFKIVKTCDSNSLTDCFAPTTTTGETLNETDKINEKSSIVGVVFSDGTNMLIKYNPEAEGIDEFSFDVGKIEHTSKNSTTFPIYGDLFEYAIDVNSLKAPNVKGKDIMGNLSLAEKAGNPYGLSFEIVQNPTTNYSPINNSSSGGSSNDYQAGAIAYCKTLNARLPSIEDMDEIAEKIYSEACSTKAPFEISDSYNNCNSQQINTNELKQILGNEDYWTTSNYSTTGRKDFGRVAVFRNNMYRQQGRETYYNHKIICIK